MRRGRPAAYWTLALTGTLLSHTAESRFLEQDVEKVDQEERLNTETYNDFISYRYPVSWQRLWEARDVGFRMHAGSLNVNRFDYDEEVKLHAYMGDVPVLLFVRHRHEDYVERRTEQFVRLSAKPASWGRVSLLGDGGSHKEFGDVGAAFAVSLDRQREIEAFYWSVDHYYATKKEFPEDERTRETKTGGTSFKWQWAGFAVAGGYEFDSPLRWKRESEGYHYEYWRKTGNLRATFGDLESDSWFVAASHEQKQEGKIFLAPSRHEKNLLRKVTVAEIGRERLDPQADYGAGLLGVWRDARYRFSASPDLDEKDYVEEPGPETSMRREVGAYLTRHAKGGEWNPLYGLQFNHVRIDEGGSLYKGEEVKLQTGLEAVFTPQARMLLNVTWDLDQLARDYPYRERPFRPWGGGDLQFLAVF